MTIDRAAADALLTTTRSVRKRLDLERPVPAELIDECIEVALQAPTGSNQQNWAFVVVTDPDKKRFIADCYRRGGEIMAGQGYPPPLPDGDPRAAATTRVMDSAMYLAERFEQVPVFVIPCVQGRVESLPMVVAQASAYGSILPAAWSFMLAARARKIAARAVWREWTPAPPWVRLLSAGVPREGPSLARKRIPVCTVSLSSPDDQPIGVILPNLPDHRLLLSLLLSFLSCANITAAPFLFSIYGSCRNCAD